MQSIYTDFPNEEEYIKFLWNFTNPTPEYTRMSGYDSFNKFEWVAVHVEDWKFMWYSSKHYYKNLPKTKWIPIINYTLYPLTLDNPMPVHTKYTLTNVAIDESAEIEPISAETYTTQQIKLYKTTEGNLLLTWLADGDRYYDKEGNEFSWDLASFGAPTSKVRSDNAIFKKIFNASTEAVKKASETNIIDNIGGFDVHFNKKDFSLAIDVKGEMVSVDADALAKIKKEMNAFEKIKTALTKSANTYRTGDRILLYWPTGTWKTYDFLASAIEMQKTGAIDEFSITTITDGFEDIDFLAHIVPTEKGITYVENKIVTLLREASNGKKVAILLDELNRGSKSFLNLILKLLDAVDGKTYTLNNFVKNEHIIIPIENVMFFGTMNLGWKYVGTNALDEALLDRFNIIQYKGYDLNVEKDIIKYFGTHASNVIKLIADVRSLSSSGELRAPISTRGVKMWAESFINSPKSTDDVLGSFKYTLMYRLVSVDDMGNPNQTEIAMLMKKFKDYGFLV